LNAGERIFGWSSPRGGAQQQKEKERRKKKNERGKTRERRDRRGCFSKEI
jgi:hypothetical protein